VDSLFRVRFMGLSTVGLVAVDGAETTRFLPTF